jgi:hypothetical protein
MNRQTREELLITYGYLKARLDVPLNIVSPIAKVLFKDKDTEQECVKEPVKAPPSQL